MKKLLLSIITLTAFGFGASAQNVNIPDANFKSYLVGNTAINTNSDTEIQVSEASAFAGWINCSSLSISDLTGIEAFTALTTLSCNSNQLTNLDLTQNTALTVLYCNHNQLTNLDLTQNTALTVIECTWNQLTSLDVTQNTALTILNCQYNQLTSLDVTQNTVLDFLYCASNQITSLDISQNTVLTRLTCQVNQLTSLNVANGNNTNMTNSWFHATNNSNLTCIQVDNIAYSTTNWTNIDAGPYFSTNCGACIVNIPDANFKSFLVGNTAINTNGNSVIECTEASAFTGTINCNNQSISNLTGIEAFTSLTQLICYENSITSIDVSNNTALTNLNCYSNSITSINISNNAAITEFDFWDNALIYANVANGNNSNFTVFWISNNSALTCVQVDNVSYSTTNWSNIDAGASFNLDCTVLVNSILVQGQSLATTITTNGGTLNMYASVLPANATDATYTWSVVNGTGSATISPNGSLGILTALTDGTVTVIATANDASGITGSAVITISNQSVGINDINGLLSVVEIYPNPATSQITLNTTEQIESINIIDITGKTVKTIVSNSNTIDVSDLTKGIYFLQVQTKNGIANSKFIKE